MNDSTITSAQGPETKSTLPHDQPPALMGSATTQSGIPGQPEYVINDNYLEPAAGICYDHFIYILFFPYFFTKSQCPFCSAKALGALGQAVSK